MEDDITAAHTRPRLYGIVQAYIQKKLPRDIHPAFKALRDREESAVTPLQIDVSGETTLSVPTTQVQTFQADQIRRSGDDVDEENPPL